jgi:hypothetical protein
MHKRKYFFPYEGILKIKLKTKKKLIKINLEIEKY